MIASIELSSLNGTNGFVLSGIDYDDSSGISVASAGDFNGDGLADVIVGAFNADPAGRDYAGESYVVFGRTGGFAASLALSALNGSNGFVLNGIDPSDRSGVAVAGAGDVNGDGIEDLIIGAVNADPAGQDRAGESYVVFGRTGGFAASFDLSSLNGTNGFVLNGIDAVDGTGRAVARAGDVNGDGLGDLIIGAPSADPNVLNAAGETYVVFGQTGGFAASFDLSALNGGNGFVLNGIDAGDSSGRSVASAGDVNSDGFDDLIIGARDADPANLNQAGETYIVFGKSGGFGANLDLSALNGANGFVVNGVDAFDRSGVSVASAGDVNGDGFDDLIIGATGADPGGRASAGETYVVFGKAGGFGASLNLSALDGENGFVLNGTERYDDSGSAVASAGDVNGDGFDDLLIGAPGADGAGDRNYTGETYVVFGKAGGFAASVDLSSLDSTDALVLKGIGRYDYSGSSVASAGDINGDGFDDLIIGAYLADPDARTDAGASYVIFGSRELGNVAPVAVDDVASTDEHSAIAVIAVLGNDSDGNTSDVLTVTAVDTTGVLGLVTDNGAGMFAYDPNGVFDGLSAGQSATESFTYAIADGRGGTDTATVTITVHGVSDTPTATDDTAATTSSNLVIIAVTGNDLDPDQADVLRVNSLDLTGTQGLVTINADGTLSYSPNGAFDTLAVGSVATDRFSYSVTDDNGGTDTATVTVTVAGDFALSSLNGSNGFVLSGVDASDASGVSVAGAGDVNGDGIDDLIIGADGGDPAGRGYAGESYVVFGRTGGFAANLSLSALNGSNGFVLNGIDPGDYSGRSVSSAGDINGDGFDDLIVGAPYAFTIGPLRVGESYVVFGRSGGFAASLNLSSLNGSNGFVLNGIDSADGTGRAVARAGDVNGDGLGDLIIGAPSADPNGRTEAGETYVVFGRTGGFAASFSLSALNGGNGFVLNGVDAFDRSGRSVASAGDVNGDGIDDLIIGASSADPAGRSDAGESYVVFGRTSGFAASLELSSLNGNNGFVLNGTDAFDVSGYTVAGAGDVNGDGFDDLIIGATGADPAGRDRAGETYVVFGRAGGFAASVELSTLNGSNGFVLNGVDPVDVSGRPVASAGDVNGDGFDDLIIGATGADPAGRPSAGESYLVFGRAGGFASSLELAGLHGASGLVLNGIVAGDQAGFSVAGAGDVNDDGFDDLIISARDADPAGRDRAGEAYVVFGAASFGNLAPVAADDAASTDENTAIAAIAVRINDTDENTTDVLTVVGVDTTGTLGAVTLNSDGTIGYNPNGAFNSLAAGQSATDRFTYTLSDGRGGTDTATVTITINGVTDIPTITGTPGNDTLAGTDLAEMILALGGDDSITGGLGNDTIEGSTGRDLIRGGNGLDLIRGGDGVDTLFGEIGNDTIEGGFGNDQLDGAAGNDRLVGGRANDRVTGGNNNDTFVFSKGDATDTVVDFDARGNDVIELSGFGAAFDTFAEVLGIASVAGTAIRLNFGAGDVLVLSKTTLASLTADDFVFA